MSVSMERQLKHAVCECFTPGNSKRKDKFNRNIDTSWKIYSTSSRRDMLDLCKDFGRYVKENHPEIKKAYEIPPNVVQSYVESKTGTCTQKTIDKVVSRMGKLEKVCMHAYSKSPFHWGIEEIEKPLSTKTNAFTKNKSIPMDMTREILKKLTGSTKSQAINAVTLCAYTGMRANEAVHCKAGNITLKGGEFGYGFITIPEGADGGAKGGRKRIVPLISMEAQNAIANVLTHKDSDDYIAAKRNGKCMSPDNIQRMLREHMDKTYGKQFTGNRCHALRKTWAQTYYDCVRNKGYSKKEAISKTNIVLGHGSKRGLEMVGMYVANIW